MTITLSISPKLEKQLRIEADKRGLEPDVYIVRALQKKLHRRRRPLSLPYAEAELLRHINLDFTEEFWQHYHDLLAKRRAETLTSSEHTELIALSDKIEQANAQRMGYLVELAQLRGVTLLTLLKQLGLETNPYA